MSKNSQEGSEIDAAAADLPRCQQARDNNGNVMLLTPVRPDYDAMPVNKFGYA